MSQAVGKQPLGRLKEPIWTGGRFPVMDMTTMLLALLIAAIVLTASATKSRRRNGEDA
ncbi:hypothetical protein [Brevundimonas sp. Bb-A]|jgi:hypothetical protein|uniref:hypothetical protein n=1 Tax=Brevundimonas sp. Bb-A TaxID=2560058 RepID=UPI00128EFB2E|nr:hypothetical protein [Brevundimonas sp. Bb-A]QFU30263.1 hypothetical protein BSP_01170 [Brevundimonas sp. Bb-A]